MTPSLSLWGTNVTSDSYEELPLAKRRRLMARAALRGLLVTTLLVVLYYQLPLHQHWGVNAGVRVLAGLLVFAGASLRGRSERSLARVIHRSKRSRCWL